MFHNSRLTVEMERYTQLNSFTTDLSFLAIEERGIARRFENCIRVPIGKDSSCCANAYTVERVINHRAFVIASGKKRIEIIKSAKGIHENAAAKTFPGSIRCANFKLHVI